METTCKYYLNCKHPTYTEAECDRHCVFYDPKDVKLFIHEVICKSEYDEKNDEVNSQFGMTIYPVTAESEDGSIVVDTNDGLAPISNYKSRTLTPKELIGALIAMVHHISDKWEVPYTKLPPKGKKKIDMDIVNAINNTGVLKDVKEK